MPSPFPGMNPYLEHPYIWPDFHQTFVTALRTALTPQVVPAYFVRVQIQVYLRGADDDDRQLIGIPDAEVGPEPGGGGGAGTATATATIQAPAEVTVPDLLDERHAYLEILDRDGRQVLTVIELLSPTNKYAGVHRDAYLRKRRDLLSAGVNVVEIDLLRGGPRLPLDGLPVCSYYVLVARAARRPKADVWPVRLREPLPTVPIPLAPGDREARADLQAVLHRVYDDAGYAYGVYRRPPVPRLPPDDAAWAEALTRPAAPGPGGPPAPAGA